MPSPKPTRIALSYRRASAAYDNYERAARLAAKEERIAAEVYWAAVEGESAGGDLAFDALVLTGGDDVDPARYGASDPGNLCELCPERDETEWRILEAALDRGVPILAICRGAQILNVHEGGTLHVDLGEKNATHRAGGDGDRMHRISASPSLLAPGGHADALVNSSHHQAVDRLAPAFRAAAFCGDGVLEAFEWSGGGRPWLIAVQWHPERLPDEASPFGRELFRRLLREAALTPKA